MHKSAIKCNEALGKWCKNKHGASKIMDTLETYHWDGEVPPEPSPSVSIAVSAISIDLTTISINLAISYDEEGVVLPWAEGSAGSYVVHLSLP
jgi:hypothetical protein